MRRQVVAVGSRDVKKSQEWTDQQTGPNSGVKAYGSYEGVVGDEVSKIFKSLSSIF